MNGFTGINEGAIHEEINEFKGAVEQAYNTFDNAVNYFFDSLKEKWASPEAANLTSKWWVNLVVLEDNLDNDSTVTMDKVEDTAENLARAVGGTYSRITYNMSMSSTIVHDRPQKGCEQNMSGQILMDVDSVKTIRKIFVEMIDETVTLIDKIPTELSVYDAKGNIKASYKNRVQEIKQDIINEVKNISNEIDQCIMTYETNVENAASSSKF